MKQYKYRNPFNASEWLFVHKTDHSIAYKHEYQFTACCAKSDRRGYRIFAPTIKQLAQFMRKMGVEIVEVETEKPVLKQESEEGK